MPPLRSARRRAARLPRRRQTQRSCFETYRLARWEALDDRRVAWQEDTARIEADVDDAKAGQLRLRLRLTQEIKDEHYRLAAVPFVCPDAR